MFTHASGFHGKSIIAGDYAVKTPMGKEGVKSPLLTRLAAALYVITMFVQ